MKRQIFSFNGGFPLTQDRLDWMQQGWEEGFHAMLSPIRADLLGRGIIMSGLEVERTGDEVSIGAGWIACKEAGADAKLVRYPGTASLTVPVSTNQIMFSTGGSVFTPLLFNNGSTNNAVADNIAVASSVSLAFSPIPGFQVLYDQMYTYAEALGISSREEEFNELDCTSGDDTFGVGGVLYYKKDVLANTLHINGTINITDPSGIANPPAVEPILLGTIPADYAPTPSIPTSVLCNIRPGGGGLFRLYLGGVLNHATVQIGNDGAVVLLAMRPLDIVTEYAVDVNAIVPLG